MASRVPNLLTNGYRLLQGPVEGTVPIDPTVMQLTILGLIDRCWTVDLPTSEFLPKAGTGNFWFAILARIIDEH